MDHVYVQGGWITISNPSDLSDLMLLVIQVIYYVTLAKSSFYF